MFLVVSFYVAAINVLTKKHFNRGDSVRLDSYLELFLKQTFYYPCSVL